MKTCFKVFFAVLSCAWALVTHAQKLPKVQQESVYAPGDIKIDGKTTEWGDKFHAYNAGEHLFYTLANDDKNLYLIVHSSDKLTIQKIVRWGLALTISSSLNKNLNDPNNVSVSFPVADGDKNLTIVRDAAPPAGGSISNGDLMASRNSKIANMCKLIQVTGIKGIDDPTISVYNTDGIKTVAAFDNNLEYTYELALPLKYLDILKNTENVFGYNIKLNGATLKRGAPAPPHRADGGTLPDQDYLFSPTDFGGEYTLAKNNKTLN